MLAVSGIIVKDGKVLLCRRHRNALQGGFWEFPTYELEGDDSLEDSLERNLFDCFSVQVAGPVFLGSADLGGKDQMRIFSYGAKTNKNPVECKGYSRCKWLKIKELCRFRLSSACVTAINGVQIL